MANDCLVTRLKGTVQNGSLPILNTIRMNILAADPRVGVEETFLIATGDDVVNITSKVPFHVGTTAAVTSYQIPANTLQNFVLKASEITTDAVDSAITIEGGIYGLKSLTHYGFTGWLKIKGSDGDSLNYADGLVAQACTPDDEVKNGVKVLCIDDVHGADTVNEYPTIIPSSKDVVVLWGLNTTSTGMNPVMTTNALAKLPYLKHCNVRVSGDIKDLPLNTEVMYVPTGLTTGSLEDFVADRRTKGKTSGVIAFNAPQYTWVVTYQGTAIKDLSTSVRPMIDNVSYFTWDATTMGFASSAPQGVTVYGSPFAAVRDAIAGNL